MNRTYFRQFAGLLIGLALLVACSSNSSLPFLNSSARSLVPDATKSGYTATVRYVTTFYPLWFTFQQAKIATTNRLVGPIHMGPLFHEVVAPNDDTLYCSTFTDLSKEPLIVTIPSSNVIFSVLSTDAFGDVFETGIKTSGAYALTGPGWNGVLPAGVTQVALPNNFSNFIIRADKFSASGVDQTRQAEIFRARLRAAVLSTYVKNPKAGPPLILPLAAYVTPFKTIADKLIESDPEAFLKQLQAAVASANTPPLSPGERSISDNFNKLFDANPGGAGFASGARQAHEQILEYYLNNRGKTNWITFDSIGTTWTNIVRSSITEFIQYGNNRSTAAYYQAFVDSNGNVLDGSSHAYVVTFTKPEIPQTVRFWSITAYTPDSITLIKNAANKYLVGSYTPGLRKGRGGSVSIYMSTQQPKGVPAGNWLPVPSGPFTIMLRAYGPAGTVKARTYVPPAVTVFR